MIEFFVAMAILIVIGIIYEYSDPEDKDKY